MSLPPVTLKIGDRDITGSHDGLTFSNVDPGGYEILTANPSVFAGIRPGAPIIARCGLETVFFGRLNEPGQKQSGQRDSFSLAGLGAGDILKRGRIQEIWVDSDLTRWQGPGVQRQIGLVTASFQPGGPEVVRDPSSPGLKTAVSDEWASPVKPVCEAWYDAAGLSIGSLYYAWTKGGNISAVDTNWNWVANLEPSSTTVGPTDTTGNLRATGPSSGALGAAAAGRAFAALQLYYNSSPAGAAGTDYPIFWTCLATYGTHTLTKRGVSTASTPQGFYPDDIAWDAVSRATGGIVRGRVDQASSYIVQHYTQLTPVPHETVPLDMAKLMGWHTGVWEPLTMFGTQPAWYFHRRPSQPTCSVSRYECSDVDLPKVRLDQLYDTAKVAWRDPAGASGVQTVTINNPYLAEAGISGQVLDLDAGVSSAAAASAYGTFALRLALESARGSGYAVLPLWVRDTTGARRPSCTLKAGRDRLQLRNLPDSGPLTGSRYDSFRIQRVENTMQNGLPQTRVEFDGGADLMEVLNARLTQARVFTGP